VRFSRIRSCGCRRARDRLVPRSAVSHYGFGHHDMVPTWRGNDLAIWCRAETRTTPHWRIARRRAQQWSGALAAQQRGDVAMRHRATVATSLRSAKALLPTPLYHGATCLVSALPILDLVSRVFETRYMLCWLVAALLRWCVVSGTPYRRCGCACALARWLRAKFGRGREGCVPERRVISTICNRGKTTRLFQMMV